MNKQEEIREGLITKIESIRAWGGSPDDPLSPEDDVADILRYLDRKGVVIKVGDDIDIEMTDGVKLPRFAKYEPLVESHKPEEKEE